MAKKSAKKAAKPAKKSSTKANTKSSKGAASLAPKPIKTGPGPSAMEIGQAVVASVNKGMGDMKLWDAFWSPAIESIEGLGAEMVWTGRKAMEAKGEQWMSTHTIHGASAEGPYVGATGFAVKFRMDVTDTTTGKRELMEEVGVYTVKNGKVIREEFMYGTGASLPPA